MRGFPLKNLLWVLLLFAGLTIPMLRVDRPRELGPAEVESGPHPVAVVLPGLLRLRFAHAPLAVEVAAAGRPVALRGEGLEREGEVSLEGANPGLEISLKVTWPAGTGRTVVEVGAAPDGQPEQLRNVWVEGSSVEEILRFSWRARP